MNFHDKTSKPLSNLLLWPSLRILLLFMTAQVAYSLKNTSIGVVININSDAGKQQRRAMQIAVQTFNNYSKNHNNIHLFFRDSGGIPLQAALAAEELITKKKVKVIVGMETWQEAALVADIANKAQIPIISFSSPPIAPPLMQHRWPFLIQMAKNQAAHLNCIADIIDSYNWQKVIAIYEDNPYSGDNGLLSLFSEALQKGNAEIEDRLVLPSFTSLSDPKGVVLDELLKLLPVKSRVFVVLQASVPMLTHLFREAKKVRFFGNDSVWIINEEITSMLDFANKSVLSSMNGTLGIKTFYSTNSIPYTQLQENFQHELTETTSSKPGSDALRAYDSVTIIAEALDKMNSNSSNSRVFLEKMLSSNFNGLSGNITFKENHLSNTPQLRIINVVNEEYKELDFWTQKLNTRGDYATNNLTGRIVWPGGLISDNPKGWKMPTDTEPLKVALTANPAFENFLKVEDSSKKPTGFCIDLFSEVQKILSDRYSGMPYEFDSIDESYEEILQSVINKSHDVIVGDITILSNRSKYVSFTQPYTESGLSVVFPIEFEGSAWLFTKPFSLEMWMTTIGISIYTMFIIWFLEHHFNPDFGGPLKNQISTTLWFAFTSLFFAHKEKINSNSARVVVGVWLFLVFVLTSSYTANLSSMLTVKRMKSGRDIEWLKRNNLSVGCDSGSSLVKDYMENVYSIPPHQIIDVDGEDDIVAKFKSKTISALFLESPYEKVFLNKYCKDYTAITAAYRFGGLGFVFQKGSPMARDFSEAILTLAENGTLRNLELKWLTPSKECSTSSTSREETESLTLNNFWSLYIICAGISTICFVRALFTKYLHNYNHCPPEEEAQLQSNVTTEDDSFGNKAIRISVNNQTLARDSFGNKAIRISVNNQTLARATTFSERGTNITRRRNSPGGEV